MRYPKPELLVEHWSGKTCGLPSIGVAEFEFYDGMGEGWGDYWAATNAQRHASANHTEYDPAVGEWDATAYNPGNPPFLRRVDTNAHYPENYSDDPHVTGMIWSASLWGINNQHHAVRQPTSDCGFRVMEGIWLLWKNASPSSRENGKDEG